MVLWSVLMLYLVCDFFIFNGPLRGELRRMFPTKEDKVAEAMAEGICAKVYNAPIYLSQVERRVRERLWRTGRDPHEISEEEISMLHWLALDELIAEALLRIKVRVNIEQARVPAEEVDAELAATENLMLSLGVSYNQTEIDDPALSVLPCGAGCTVLDPAGSFPGSVSIDGNDLPRAPEWMYNFVARYNMPLANGDLYFQTDWVYRSEFSMFLYDSAEFHADSFLEGGLNMGYVTERWEVGVYGRNITDELKLIAAIDFNNLEGIINEQFTYGIEGTFRF